MYLNTGKKAIGFKKNEKIAFYFSNLAFYAISAKIKAFMG